MRLTIRLFCAYLTAALLIAKPLSAGAADREPVPVRLERAADGYQLLRDGKPYFIRGAGGDGSLALLAKSGGNSIRTWGAENLDKKLDEAHRLGLTVAVSIWLGHERHGFDYNNADQVAAQMEQVRQTVERYKNHPAVLLWGLGNEMEGYERGDNAANWSAINNLATLVKQLDPNHPTMTARRSRTAAERACAPSSRRRMAGAAWYGNIRRVTGATSPAAGTCVARNGWLSGHAASAAMRWSAFSSACWGPTSAIATAARARFKRRALPPSGSNSRLTRVSVICRESRPALPGSWPGMARPWSFIRRGAIRLNRGGNFAHLTHLAGPIEFTVNLRRFVAGEVLS